jgi:hypothetical protein
VVCVSVCQPNTRTLHCGLQLQEIKKNEDPRLSFCTPEFKEAQRTFTDAFKVGMLCLCVHRAAHHRVC